MEMVRADGKRPGLSAQHKRIVFARHYIANGYNATQAARQITSGTSINGASVLGHRMLRDNKVQEEIVRQTAAILTPEQVKERISALADGADTDANKLRALELMARVHALLTERNINENLNKNEAMLDLRNVTTDQLTDELTSRLKLSSQGILPQVIESK